MNIDTKKLLKTAGVITALGVILSATMAVGNYTELRPVILREFILAQNSDVTSQTQLMQQAQQIQQVQQLQRFQLLDMKRTFGTLTWDEIQERCRIAQALGYVMSLVDGCK